MIEIRLAVPADIEARLALQTITQSAVVIPVGRVYGDVPVTISVRREKRAHPVALLRSISFFQQRETKKQWLAEIRGKQLIRTQHVRRELRKIHGHVRPMRVRVVPDKM